MSRFWLFRRGFRAYLAADSVIFNTWFHCMFNGFHCIGILSLFIIIVLRQENYDGSVIDGRFGTAPVHVSVQSRSTFAHDQSTRAGGSAADVHFLNQTVLDCFSWVAVVLFVILVNGSSEVENGSLSHRTSLHACWMGYATAARVSIASESSDTILSTMTIFTTTSQNSLLISS